MNENNVNLPEEEEAPFIITLDDGQGGSADFEVLDVIEGYKGHDYVVLLPADESDNDVVILEIVDGEEPDTEDYLSVDDEDLVLEIFELFKERNIDNFDFAD